jgi:hypothetical protein
MSKHISPVRYNGFRTGGIVPPNKLNYTYLSGIGNIGVSEPETVRTQAVQDDWREFGQGMLTSLFGGLQTALLAPQQRELLEAQADLRRAGAEGAVRAPAMGLPSWVIPVGAAVVGVLVLKRVLK